MKNNTLAFLFLCLWVSTSAQLSYPKIDSLNPFLQVVPTTLLDTSIGSEKKTVTASETLATAKPIFVDTQHVVIFDTVKLKETKRENKIKQILLPDQQKEEEPKEEGIQSLGEVVSFSNIFWSLIILVLSYFTIKAIVTILDRFAEKSTTYRIALKSISPFVRIIGWIIALIWIIEGVFQPPHEAIWAFLASAGIAIGFAAQDILKNIFGGIMILFDRPFQVGDKIEVGNYYGEVKEIGLRSTRIVTKDDSLVSVPNAEVVNSAVSNSNSGEANCQVVAEIYLPIDANTNLARVIATEAAQVSRYIYLNKPITVLFFNEVKEHRSYLKMRLKAYVSDIRNEFAFQSDMTEIVMREFLEQGILNKEELL